MTKIIFTGFLILCSLLLKAQTLSQGLLFSRNNTSATARALSLGNNMGALGGDLSSLSQNPAGLGLYRSSSFMYSGLASFSGSRSVLLYNSNAGNLVKAQFGALGAVFAMPTKKKNGLRFFNFALGVQRIANFTKKYVVKGVTQGSRSISFLERADEFAPSDLDDYELGLAYDAYLIDYDSSSGRYEGALIDTDETKKEMDIIQSGGINEFNIAFSGNYNNRLYIGGSMNIPFLKFKENRYYTETVIDQTLPLETFYFDEFTDVSGLGINLKLGAIYRLSKIVRIGAAVHTPTAYALNESYDTELSSRVWYNGELKEETHLPDSPASYSHGFQTPWRLSGSITAVFPKKGFVSMGVTYKDYSQTRFSASDGGSYISDLNEDMRTLYKSALRFNVGGELVFNQFRLRGGYAYQSSPYNGTLPGIKDEIHTWSAGLGVRHKKIFFDLGFSQHFVQDDLFLFEHSNQITNAIGTNTLTQIMLTVGTSI